jgi:hypothetical protein
MWYTGILLYNGITSSDDNVHYPEHVSTYVYGCVLSFITNIIELSDDAYTVHHVSHTRETRLGFIAVRQYTDGGSIIARRFPLITRHKRPNFYGRNALIRL